MENKKYKDFLNGIKVMKYQPLPLDMIDIEWDYDRIPFDNLTEGERRKYSSIEDIYQLNIKFNKMPNNFIYYKRDKWNVDNDYSILSIIDNKLSFIYYQNRNIKFSISNLDISKNNMISFVDNSMHELKEIINKICGVIKTYKAVEYKESSFGYSDLFLYNKNKKVELFNLLVLNSQNKENQIKQIIENNQYHRVNHITATYTDQSIMTNKVKNFSNIIIESFDTLIKDYCFIRLTNNIRSIVDKHDLSVFSVYYHPKEIRKTYNFQEVVNERK